MTDAKLTGGPFDGDSGPLKDPIAPDSLWCVQCSEPAKCSMAGVHWWLKAASAEKDAKRQAERGGFADGEVHRYLHARVDGHVHVYVYGDLTDDGRKRMTESEFVRYFKRDPAPA